MYREILFKAKRKNWRELPKEQWWVEGLLWKKKYKSDKWYISCFPDKDDHEEVYCVDTNTICQYTGTRDKNNNKIWENDVVKLPKLYANEIGTVEYIWCGFRVRNSAYGSIQLCGEVIGNIFDNPELLKRQ